MYIEKNYDRDALLPADGRRLLEKFYLKPGETSAQDAFARTAVCFDGGNTELGKRIYEAASKKWIGFSSPTLSNSVYPGERMKAQPISCYVQYVPNSISGLCDHTTELRMASVLGAGIGADWSDVQSTDKKSPGSIAFQHTVDSDMVAYKQGQTRRASYGSYKSVRHPEILEHIKMRIPEGDINRQNLNLHHGVTIDDKFMYAVDNDLDWELIDPEDKRITDTLKARKIWELILDTRFRTGEPYIFHIDEANRNLHPAQKALGLKIRSSNLCSEIFLPTGEDRSAVCVLSSLNMDKYDEWKDTSLVSDMVEFLDNVITKFLENAPEALGKAVYSASRERAIGLGVMGWADYMQRKGISFESPMSIGLTHKVFRDIREKADAATLRLGAERGEAPDMVGTGRRNSTTMAIAPTSNNATIVGVSPTIEPRQANWFIQKTRLGSLFVKNPVLEDFLEELGMNVPEVWDKIKQDKGSVRNLEFLTEDQKALFKTSKELDQRSLVDNARVRQSYVDQGQSFNVFFTHGVDKEYVNQVHRRAFSKNGLGDPLKSMYYLRAEKASAVKHSGTQIERTALKDGESFDDCINCEG